MCTHGTQPPIAFVSGPSRQSVSDADRRLPAGVLAACISRRNLPPPAGTTAVRDRGRYIFHVDTCEHYRSPVYPRRSDSLPIKCDCATTESACRSRNARVFRTYDPGARPTRSCGIGIVFVSVPRDCVTTRQRARITCCSIRRSREPWGPEVRGRTFVEREGMG